MFKRFSRSSLLHSLYHAARIAALAAIFFILYKRINADWDAARLLAFRGNALDFGAALLAGLVSYPLLAGAWIVLLKQQGLFQKKHFAYYFRVWLTSYLYRYAPGKWFLVTERARLGRELGIPAGVGAFIALCETLLVLLAAGAGSVYVAPIVFDGIELPVWLMVLLVLAVLVGLPLGIRNLHRLPYVGSRMKMVTMRPLEPTFIWIVTGIYLALWSIFGCSLFFFIRLFHPLDLAMLPYICSVFAMSYALGILAFFAPAGLGVREASLSVGLSAVLPAGTATALALASRLWFTALELVLLAFVIATVRKPRMDGVLAPDRL